MATRAANEKFNRDSKEKIAQLDREATEKIEARKDKTTKRGQNFKFATDAARGAGSVIGGIASLMNHPEWYKKYVDGTYECMLPTFTRAGKVMSGNWLSNFPTISVNQGLNVVSGICAINYLSTLPNQGSSYIRSPINVSLSRFMANLRKYNSRIGDYDPSDFGLYWYASADILYVIEKIRLCIKLYNTYFNSNAYFASAMIEANGFSPTDFFAHIAEYKILCRIAIQTFNTSIVIPKELTFFKRRLWMARSLVADHKCRKSQIYLFKQLYWGRLSATESDVTYTDHYTSLQQYSGVSTWLNGAIRDLTDSQGMQTMMADLRAGLPESSFLQLEPLSGEEAAVIIYDDVDLEQIHNALSIPGNVEGHDEDHTVIGGVSIHAMSDGYLYQGTVGSGGVPSTYGPFFTNSRLGTLAYEMSGWWKDLYTSDAFLNMYHDDTTSDDILEATRLRQQVTVNPDSELYAPVRGTEQVVNFEILTWNEATNAVIHHTAYSVMMKVAADADLDVVYITSQLTRFDWMPKVCIGSVLYTEGTATGYLYITYGEIDNYFPCNNNNLKEIHEYCAFSEFFLSDKDFKPAYR